MASVISVRPGAAGVKDGLMPGPARPRARARRPGRRRRGTRRLPRSETSQGDRSRRHREQGTGVIHRLRTSSSAVVMVGTGSADSTDFSRGSRGPSGASAGASGTLSRSSRRRAPRARRARTRRDRSGCHNSRRRSTSPCSGATRSGGSESGTDRQTRSNCWITDSTVPAFFSARAPPARVRASARVIPRMDLPRRDGRADDVPVEPGEGIEDRRAVGQIGPRVRIGEDRVRGDHPNAMRVAERERRLPSEVLPGAVWEPGFRFVEDLAEPEDRPRSRCHGSRGSAGDRLGHAVSHVLVDGR